MKLFEVRCELVTYVLAEDAKDARNIAYSDAMGEALNSLGRHELHVRAFKQSDMIQYGWGPGSLVFGVDEDVTLQTAIAGFAEKP